MSNPTTKSPSHSKSDSTQPAGLPARTPSLVTASAVTDPNHISTALSNSVNTAIGTTNSGFESGSGLSDTSAGSSRSRTMLTARSSTSQEMVLNDLRRGSLFGRQSQPAATSTTGPHSVTNVTLSNNTTLSTATDLSLKEINSDVSGPSRRKKTTKKHGKRRTSCIPDYSGKSGKSGKPLKSAAKNIEKSAKSNKSASKKVAFGGEKSMKSTKSVKNGPKKPENAKKSAKKSPKVATKAEKQADSSVYLPGVQTSTGISKPSKLSKPSNYHFPGVGRNTRPDSFAAPVPVPNNPENNVYDVADLSASRRGLHAPAQPAHAAPPKSLFGKGQKRCAGVRPPPSAARQQGPSALSAALSAPRAPRSAPKPTAKEPPFGNKIVIIGATPDGKTQVQMTIDMQIVAGEALGPSKEAVTLVPKKVIVGGQETPLDSKSKND